MKMQLAQLGAIVKYEFRMQWRRRTLLVILVGMIGPAVLLSLFGQDFLAELIGAAPGVFKLQQMVISFTWTPVYAVALMALPLVAADTIPKDRQIGVSELLDSLPLPRSVYLCGKLLSLWVCALAGLLVAIPLAGAASWFGLGAYEVGEYLTMWAIGAAPLVLVNAGLGALLAAGMPNRRWAILAGITFVMFNVVMLITVVTPGSSPLWDSLNPARPAPLIYYALFGAESQPGGPNVSLQDVGLSIAGGMLELVAAGVIAWLWLRWKETTN